MLQLWSGGLVGGEADSGNVSGFEEGIFLTVLPKLPHGALTEVQVSIVLSVLQTARSPRFTAISEGDLRSGTL